MRTKKLLLILALLCTVAQGAWADDDIYCTASDVGRVVCTDGSIYDNVSAAEADGKTAVAMIAYLDTENNRPRPSPAARGSSSPAARGSSPPRTSGT